MKVGDGLTDGTDLGPITTPESYKRIHGILEAHEKEGGSLLLDGRKINMQAPYDKGLFIGPTILTDLTTDMTAYKQEIFGPSMCVLKADNLTQAIDLVNA